MTAGMRNVSDACTSVSFAVVLHPALHALPLFLLALEQLAPVRMVNDSLRVILDIINYIFIEKGYYDDGSDVQCG